MAFKLPNKRCEEIKKIVVNTFEKLNVKCIPISGFEMAIKLGAIVVPYSSKPERTRKLMIHVSDDGFSVKKDGIWYIYYNDKKCYTRINNTLMHECGHIKLDHIEESVLAEKEANFFAKYALAPPALIYKLDLKYPEEVSECFDISFEAAEYALEYYKKWLKYGSRHYTSYEIKLLNLINTIKIGGYEIDCRKIETKSKSAL